MKITLERSEGIYTLHSYHNKTIIVRPPHAQLDDEQGLLHLKRSCLLSASTLIDDWAPQQLSELSAEHLQSITEMSAELLLIGSGERLCFPSAEQRGALTRLGIGHEVMDTAAACRTFNVLVGEGRRVVALLFAA